MLFNKWLLGAYIRSANTIYVCLYRGVCVCMPACVIKVGHTMRHTVHMEVRGQPCGGDSPSLYVGHGESSSGGQACTETAIIH